MSVSVVLNLWNGDKPSYLSESFNSIINQTIRPNEIVIVIDGPVSIEIEQFLTQNIFNCGIPVKLLRLPTSQGLWAARNYGIEATTSKWILVQDADDISHPQRLEILLQFTETEKVAVIGSSMVEFDDQNRKLVSIREVPVNPTAIRKRIKLNSPVNHPTVLLNRTIFNELGMYQDVFLMEDFDLWCRVLAAGYEIVNTKACLLAFRLTDDLFVRRGGLRFVRAELTLANCLRKYELSTFPNIVFVVLIRVTYRLIPTYLRKYFHLHLLSKHKLDGQFKDLKSFLNFKQDF